MSPIKLYIFALTETSHEFEMPEKVVTVSVVNHELTMDLLEQMEKIGAGALNVEVLKRELVPGEIISHSEYASNFETWENLGLLTELKNNKIAN